MNQSGHALIDSNTKTQHWVTGHVDTLAGHVPRISTRLTWRDRIGAVAVRWNIGRMRYAVEPGLYAVGCPASDSPLLASANYKLSFDVLREALDGLNVWLLVLDTKGINVWCAAGKGSFGTEELIQRMAATDVARVVSGSTLILPQLGAPGVAAHEVQRRTSFRVVYGPVRAGDIPDFLRNGMHATPVMRRVDFSLSDRLTVAPVEFMQRFVPTILIMLAFFLGAGVERHGYRFAMDQWPGIAVAVWVNFLAGIMLVPLFLPWLPGRSFALKGASAGLVTGAVLCQLGHYGWVEGVSIVLMSLAACSFLGLMFTGCTPYTSVSGVRREIKLAVPLQIVTAVTGVIIWFIVRWK